MAQTAYEVVRSAITFQNPDRLPVMMPHIGISDVHSVEWKQICTGDPALPQSVDEWGCVWSRTEVRNMGQVTGHPLKNWSALKTYRWPDPDDPSLYDGMEQQFEGSDGKFIITKIFMLLFERMHSLHGFSNTLVDLVLGDEQIEMLADKIVEYDLALIDNISHRFPGCIHAVKFTDDWGTEQSSIISPQLWQVFFADRYRRITEAMHNVGWFTWLHTCGCVTKLVDDLIQAGVDVLNLQQPRVLGIKTFGERYAGRVCFEAMCDIQHTLPFKNVEEIEEEARLLLEYWTTAEGGFILGDYGDGEAIGVPLEKRLAMHEAFQAADPWRQK
jgi:uroporphyrinogen decarboxylase